MGFKINAKKVRRIGDQIGKELGEKLLVEADEFSADHEDYDEDRKGENYGPYHGTIRKAAKAILRHAVKVAKKQF